VHRRNGRNGCDPTTTTTLDAGFKNLEACKKLLLDPARPNPFPGRPCAADYIKNPPQFLCGRQDELARIENIVLASLAGDKSQLARIFASQGIGKSALVSWALKELIDKHGKEQVAVVSLDITDSLDDFQILTLYKQLVAQCHKSDTLKKIAFRSMSKALGVAWSKGGKLKQDIQDKLSGETRDKILADHKALDPYLSESRDVLENISTLLKNNYFLIESDIHVDDKFHITLWTAYAGTADWRKARAALEGSGAFNNLEIKSSTDALEAIKEFSTLRDWLYTDYTTVVLIDHMERIGKNEAKFSSLFSMLNTFRNHTHLCFALSGTLDAFAEMDLVIGGDKIEQIHNWEHPVNLQHLPNDIVVDIVGRHLAGFWQKTNDAPPAIHHLFPFSRNSISYLYDANQKDLRKSLIRLNDLVEEYRKAGKIEPVLDFFQAMRKLRVSRDYLLTPFEQKELVEKLMDPNVQDLSRSKQLEKKIRECLDIMALDPRFDYLSNIRHEPAIGPNGEKPDVYFELFGKTGAQSLRKIAIEVKLYRKGSEVPPAEIDKTHVLLKGKNVDYIHWVTNKPLSITGKALPPDLEAHLGRIQPLDPIELSYAALVLYYEECFGASPSADVANEILKKMGLDIEEIASATRDLKPLVQVPDLLRLGGGLDQFITPATKPSTTPAPVSTLAAPPGPSPAPIQSQSAPPPSLSPPTKPSLLQAKPVR